jgi:EAL domain-containing protein (putative c-di-GMP-specific phosphodiesterase class I)/ActR/RegA family two-component response regulator
MLHIQSLLVVDDSLVQRSHAVALARELGVVSIYEAADGIEALRLLDMLTLPPDLMLIDLEMPGMDGVQLIEAMHDKQLQIPFIVASSRESALLESVEAMARALDLQVLATLRKPLCAAALRGALQQWQGCSRRSRKAPIGPASALDACNLRQALCNNALSVHYQPKVDMRTGLLRGVEALARWQHPELGWVPPDHFVALAERSGQIHALTLAIADQALAQAASWAARGMRLSVAVNLSPLLLDRPALVREIEGLAQRHGVQPSQLVLELTESSLAACLGTALALLARLRLRGFGLSLDDFGTGFSSLLQLARVPFTELKVDRSFVHGAAQRKHLRLMLESALDMARRLEMVSVAEGVETLEDWRLLQQLGCTVGQGWLIAKAMPADELVGWRKKHQAQLPLLRAETALASTAGTTATTATTATT